MKAFHDFPLKQQHIFAYLPTLENIEIFPETRHFFPSCIKTDCVPFLLWFLLSLLPFCHLPSPPTINKITLLNHISIGPNRKFYLRKILIIFLPINLNMCFGCSKEPSH